MLFLMHQVKRIADSSTNSFLALLKIFMIWYRTKHIVIHFPPLWKKSILQLFSRDKCCQSLMVIYVVSPLSWFYGSQHNYCLFLRNPRITPGLHEGRLMPALSFGWPWGELSLVIYGKHHLEDLFARFTVI